MIAGSFGRIDAQTARDHETRLGQAKRHCGMTGVAWPARRKTLQASTIDPNTADRVFPHRITP